MAETSIEWADYTFNPWWGCQRVSPACENCYAEAWAKRTGHKLWGPRARRRFFGDDHWRKPLAWNREASAQKRPARVFCASMADVFEVIPATKRPETALAMDASRQRLWALIEATPLLDWLLLTKRPENVVSVVPLSWLDAWPWNVWLGVTAEDTLRARERCGTLARLRESLAIPIGFVSYEPALELVDFRPWFPAIDWIIIGGESGAGARPFDPVWARATVEAARAHGVTPFVKQLGRRPTGDLISLRTAKNENPDFWPEDLRVREFPNPNRKSAA